AVTYLVVGKASANRGDLDRAIGSYTAVVGLRPRVGAREWLAIAYGYRGTAYVDRGEPASAVEDFQQALALSPQRLIYKERLVLGYVARGGARLERDDLDGAIADLEAALGLASGHPTAPRTLALAYARRGLQRAEAGLMAPALEDLARALALQPQSADHLVARGRILAQAGQHEAALGDYARALELGPAWAAYYGRGRSLFALGRYPEAAADYREARIALARLPEGEERARGTELVTKAQGELRPFLPRRPAP
ncbi:MAG: tetratricopeptide repeat protein, partial [Chloroflexi bacterium]|nr:tetratricopeptide repeat protein [Chloroflexota bacterium]